MKIIFMGTPDFAVPALEALFKSTHKIVAVYTQPPRPKGRGQIVQKSPVHLCAETHGAPVFHPLTFKNNEAAVKEFQSLQADIAVVAAYGLILPTPILNAPRLGCLNIHASLLPRWRGASPIQRAIWAGDSETGITIMQMEQGLDTGPMLLKKTIPITQTTTTPLLHDALAALGGTMILEALENLQNIIPEKQDENKTTYAKMLTKADGKINWGQSATEIDCQIRALNPWPGTYTTTQKGRLKILSAQIGPSMEGPVGHVRANGFINCGNNTSLKLIMVQPENTKAMDAASAINGGYLQSNTVFT